MTKKILFLFCVFLSIPSTYGNYDKIHSRLTQMSYTELLHFHKIVLKVHEHRWQEQNYQLNEVNEDYSFINFIINKAYANDGYLFCNYGGWVSLMRRGRDCLPPYYKKVRTNPMIQNFGPVYSRDYSCGRKNYFRCSPITFGVPSSNKGICVSTIEKDPNQVMLDCLNAHRPHVESHIKILQDDPEKMIQYTATVSELDRYCNSFRGKFEACDEAQEVLHSTAKDLTFCENPRRFFPLMNELLTDENISGIRKVQKNLVEKYEDYISRYEDKVDDVTKENKEMIEKEIELYSSSDKTKKMIRKIKENSTRCIFDSCNRVEKGYESTAQEVPLCSKKAVRKQKICKTKKGYIKKFTYSSVGKCYRYVKVALQGSEHLSHYLDGLHAKNSGSHLKNAGFENLLEYSGFSHLTPRNSPKGAVLVYDGGPSGHIEVKLDDDKFGSDYISDTPINESRWLKRKLIGVYIKPSPKLKKSLKKIPEIGDEL